MMKLGDLQNELARKEAAVINAETKLKTIAGKYEKEQQVKAALETQQNSIVNSLLEEINAVEGQLQLKLKETSVANQEVARVAQEMTEAHEKSAQWEQQIAEMRKETMSIERAIADLIKNHQTVEELHNGLINKPTMLTSASVEKEEQHRVAAELRYNESKAHFETKHKQAEVKMQEELNLLASSFQAKFEMHCYEADKSDKLDQENLDALHELEMQQYETELKQKYDKELEEMQRLHDAKISSLKKVAAEPIRKEQEVSQKVQSPKASQSESTTREVASASQQPSVKSTGKEPVVSSSIRISSTKQLMEESANEDEDAIFNEERLDEDIFFEPPVASQSLPLPPSSQSSTSITAPIIDKNSQQDKQSSQAKNKQPKTFADKRSKDTKAAKKTKPDVPAAAPAETPVKKKRRLSMPEQPVLKTPSPQKKQKAKSASTRTTRHSSAGSSRQQAQEESKPASAATKSKKKKPAASPEKPKKQAPVEKTKRSKVPKRITSANVDKDDLSVFDFTD